MPTVIAIRHSSFNFLFKNKGQKSNDSGHILLEKKDFERCHFPEHWDTIIDSIGDGSGHIRLEKKDFERCHFPEHWDTIIDSIGDGIKIDFPVKVRLFLSWSPKTHTLIGESIVPCPRYGTEKVSILFC